MQDFWNGFEKRAEYSENQLEAMLRDKAMQDKKPGIIRSALGGVLKGGLAGLGVGALIAAKSRGGFSHNADALPALMLPGAVAGGGIGIGKGLLNTIHNNRINDARERLMAEGPDRSRLIRAVSPDSHLSRYTKADLRDSLYK
jgi:hypothetical protein